VDIKRCSRVFWVVIFCAWPSFVWAGGTDNKGTQSHFYQPATDPYGFQSIDSAEVLGPLSMYFGAFCDYSKNPVERAGGVVRDEVVGDLTVVEGVFGIGLPFGLEVGIVVPYAIEENGFEIDEANRRLDSTGVLDIRMDAKWQAFVSPSRKWSFALKAYLTLPTGRQSQFRGEDGQYTAAGLVIAEYRAQRFRTMANFGYQFIEESVDVGGVTFDDRILLRFGFEFALFQHKSRTKAGRTAGEERSKARQERRDRGEAAADDEWTMYEQVRRGYFRIYEVAIQGSIDTSFRASHPSEEESFPAEVYSGLAFRCSHGVTLQAGIGAGLANGVGTPDYRFYVGLSYTFGEPFTVSHLFQKN
jgi:hypothetical protein